MKRTMVSFVALATVLVGGLAFGGRINDTSGLNLIDLTRPGGNVTGSPTFDEAERCLTDEEAAAVGVTQYAAPILDVFGAARRVDRIALGPLNVPTSGLVIFFR